MCCFETQLRSCYLPVGLSLRPLCVPFLKEIYSASPYAWKRCSFMQRQRGVIDRWKKRGLICISRFFLRISEQKGQNSWKNTFATVPIFLFDSRSLFFRMYCHTWNRLNIENITYSSMTLRCTIVCWIRVEFSIPRKLEILSVGWDLFVFLTEH